MLRELEGRVPKEWGREEQLRLASGTLRACSLLVQPVSKCSHMLPSIILLTVHPSFYPLSIILLTLHPSTPFPFIHVSFLLSTHPSTGLMLNNNSMRYV